MIASVRIGFDPMELPPEAMEVFLTLVAALLAAFIVWAFMRVRSYSTWKRAALSAGALVIVGVSFFALGVFRMVRVGLAEKLARASGPVLVLVAAVLTGLTVWTYWSARQSTGKRLGIILALRLAALVVACLLVFRPSLAFQEDAVAVPSKLIFVLDYSESMKINDEADNHTRWDHVKRLLQSPRVRKALSDLAGQQRVEIVYYQFAEDLKKFDPKGQATGKRTDFGLALHELLVRHGKEGNLRSVLVISDGADNGTQYNALDKADAWRSTCPVHPFAAGRPTTSRDQNDIYWDMENIHSEPAPVPIKGKLTVRGVAHAPGFDGQAVRVSLWLTGKDGQANEVASKKITLQQPKDNEIALTCEAPNVPGEYKATLKIDPVQGEITDANNAITTYVTVTKEGVSVLWVEGKKRAFESVFAIRHALSRDPQFRVYYAERLKEKNPQTDQDHWFDFDKRHYDVIIIGDISASRFSGGNKAVFKKIRKMIAEGTTGLAMLGGYESFGNSDWHTDLAADLTPLLPIDLDPAAGHIDNTVTFQPTQAGLKYLLRVAGDDEASKKLWEKIDPPLDGKPRLGPRLDGMTKLGKNKPGKTEVLATIDDDEPVLASITLAGGKVRTLAFGGDTTWKNWRRTKDGLAVYEQFWRQMILWLAHRDEAEGDVRVTLDKRRLQAGPGNRVEITVGLRGQGGTKVDKANYSVKVIAPNKQEFDVSPKGLDHQAIFDKAHWAGEYQIKVTAHGKDIKGADVGTATNPKKGEARFLAYAQDVENLRTAADHDFLGRLAKNGGGQPHLASEQQLGQFLENLSAQQQAQSKGKPQLWPEWRSNPPAPDDYGSQIGTLWTSTALPCFLLFTAFLCVEWFLRRRWGMV